MALELRLSIPGQSLKTLPMDQSPIVVGSLLSNNLVVTAAGVDPIHAVFETNPNGDWIVTDLGSDTGVKVNGRAVNVEQVIKVGDIIEIASAKISISVASAQADGAGAAVAAAAIGRSEPEPEQRPHNSLIKRKIEATRKKLLFSPKDARPSGDVLEVVAYWGGTILEVEHFHPTFKEFDRVTIGDPTDCHFIAAGKEQLSKYTMAKVKDDGYRLLLRPEMTARLRRGGNVQQVKGGSHELGFRDISHVKYGAVKYFFLFMRPPNVQLPNQGLKDPFLVWILSLSMFFFLFFSITLWSIEPKEKEIIEDDKWAIVHVPEKEKKIKKQKKIVKIKKIKKEPPPPKKPPKPKPKPVKPVKIQEKPKPKPKPPQKASRAPIPKPKIANSTAKLPKQVKVKAPKAALGGKNPSKKIGGARGAGNKKRGGQRKGRSKVSLKGVAGVKNKKSSGVNLSKLGLGVGKIRNKGGAGALHVKFKSSAGGAGGGSGSGNKTYGLGGVGSSVKSLGLAGSGNATKSFGTGSGGFLSGKGGSGKLGSAFGGGRRPTSVNVRAGDPLVSGGLTQQEIATVIRANLNQIRHCYEKLLQSSPNSAGKIKMKFVVGTNGRVKSTQITNSTISNGVMKNCVRNSVRRWAFPKPRGGSPVTVNYPFVFNPLN